MRKLVALSGGKDSTCMALLLSEREPAEYEFCFTPTGDELPPLFQHIADLEKRLGPIRRLGTQTLASASRAVGMLPSFHARWCTGLLKLAPFEAFALSQLPVETFVGLRADEPEREGAIYQMGLLVRTRFPLREWGMGVSEVRSELARRGVSVPERTDCARCPLQRLSEWHRLWRDYPSVFNSAVEDEKEFGATYRSPSRDTWPASLAELAAEFEKGRIPKERASGGCNVCRR